MIYSYTIGDWSDDGHGKCNRYQARIGGGYTEDQIKAAYFKSEEELGFGLKDIAAGYEEPVSEEHAKALYEFGFRIPESWGWSVDESDLEDYIVAIRDGSFEAEEDWWLLVFETMVKKHLPDFTAEHIAEPENVLFGGYNCIIGPDHVGYGMFY